MCCICAYKTCSKHLIEAKEWQIFFMILQQARMADRRRLSAWAFIQTFSNYSRGVSRKATSNNNFWGITISTSTMEDIIDVLTSYVVEDQLSMMRNMNSIVLCMDNFQRGQHKVFPKSQSESSTFFVGTSLLAILANEYNDTRYDTLPLPELRYDRQMRIPSMPNQPAYENGLVFSSGQLHLSLLGHGNMMPVSTPCLNGSRVEALMKGHNITHWIQHSYRIFWTKDVSTSDSGFNHDKIEKAVQCFRTERGKELVECAKVFKVESVKFWKPTQGQATPQNYLGLAAMREDSARGCGILTIDLLLRIGVLESPSRGVYVLAKDAHTRRPIFVGDRATAEGVVSWINSAENRELSFSEPPD